MKVNISRRVYLALCAFAVLLIAAFAYLLATSRDIPACSASSSLEQLTPFGQVKSNIHTYIVPSGWRHATIMINGKVVVGEREYTISRVLEAGYKYYNGNYYVTVQKDSRHSTDNFTDENAKKFALGVNRDYYVLRMLRLNDDNFIMYYGKIPDMLCSTAGK